MILPFAALLATMALGPLVGAGWWTRHYAKVALSLAAVTLGYYFFGLHAPQRVLHTAHEYISFIALIGALYVVSGGIHIAVKGEATPGANVVFLFVGALAANVLGTTGASMLLIRPWLRMNKYRVTAHHVVFFIFLVSNIGGCLTPIGDPPLFLGYLKGVPFWWVAQNCWPMWALAVALLLAMFYVVDRRNYLRAPRGVREQLAEPADEWKFEGGVNVFFLAVVVVAVFIENPPFLREGLMLAAALGSWFATKKHIHEANHFDFNPIREVAILFLGIFATMLPALDWLGAHAKQFGPATPAFFYWGTGTLSSVLDNAPTYLSFLSASCGTVIPEEVVTGVNEMVQNGFTPAGAFSVEVERTFSALNHYLPAQLAARMVTPEQIKIAAQISNPSCAKFLVAISVGSVFFGAATYIGNGPNFMVKAIADQQKVHMPGFLGYVLRFTLPFLLPVLLVVWLAFFAR